jgi:Ca2+-binding RTX toxin-like protein
MSRFTARKRNRTAPPAVEPLESRDLLAATVPAVTLVTYDGAIDKLEIIGSNANERITLSESIHRVELQVRVDEMGTDKVVDATRVYKFPYAQVKHLGYVGNEGHDEFINLSSKGGAAVGGGGNDLLSALYASGYFQGDGGNDLIYGGPGDDAVFGGSGQDTIFGFAGQDHLYGDSGNDEIHGGAGNDVLYGRDGSDRLFGEAGNDLVYGEAGFDILFGDFDAVDDVNGGHDTLYGGNDADVLYGGAGNDRLEGGSGDDALYAMSGNDSLYGNAGRDHLNGGAGNDRLDGGYDHLADRLTGGPGADLFIQHSSVVSGPLDEDWILDRGAGDRVDTDWHF